MRLRIRFSVADDGQGREEQQEQIELPLRCQPGAEQRRAAAPGWTPALRRKARHVVDRPFDDELAASVAIARYRPLMRSEGMPTSAPISAAISPPAGTVIQNGASSLDGQVCRRVGADRHERAMADRDLAGVADQDVQPDRADHGDQDQVEDRHRVVVADQRCDTDEQHAECHHRPARDWAADTAPCRRRSWS